jgi:hypothetical protein|tara:strand:+ start:268576 stop:268848 length:273 start_codon:yes stop_codon:yes gene_type:complete
MPEKTRWCEQNHNYLFLIHRPVFPQKAKDRYVSLAFFALQRALAVKTDRNRPFAPDPIANITNFSSRLPAIKCWKREWLLALPTQALILL